MDSVAFARLRDRQVSIFAEQLRLETSIGRLEPPSARWDSRTFAEHVPASFSAIDAATQRISQQVGELARDVTSVSAANFKSADAAPLTLLRSDPGAEELLRGSARGTLLMHPTMLGGQPQSAGISATAAAAAAATTYDRNRGQTRG
jgi:hypothetical protein